MLVTGAARDGPADGLLRASQTALIGASDDNFIHHDLVRKTPCNVRGYKLGAWFDMVPTFHLGVLGGYNLFPKPLTIRLPAQEPPGPLL